MVTTSPQTEIFEAVTIRYSRDHVIGRLAVIELVDSAGQVRRVQWLKRWSADGLDFGGETEQDLDAARSILVAIGYTDPANGLCHEFRAAFVAPVPDYGGEQSVESMHLWVRGYVDKVEGRLNGKK
jgi:hypothetical protein